MSLALGGIWEEYYPGLDKESILRQLLILYLLCLGGSLYAIESVFAGLCAEVNGNSAQGPGVSGGLVLGIDMQRHWAFGVKTAYSHDLDSVGILNQHALLRYYFSSFSSGLFMQAQLGYALFFLPDDFRFAFTGGWSTGWRFSPGRRSFIEPAILVGYPFFWGANLTAGIAVKL